MKDFLSIVLDAATGEEKTGGWRQGASCCEMDDGVIVLGRKDEVVHLIAELLRQTKEETFGGDGSHGVFSDERRRWRRCS